MSRLYRSHSASTIHRNHTSGIATSSVSKHPVSIYPRRRSRVNEPRVHRYVSLLSGSASLCQEIQTSSSSDFDIPDDYITNLASSRKEKREGNSSIKENPEKQQEQQQTASTNIKHISKNPEKSQKHPQEQPQNDSSIINNTSPSAMSSRRSDHSSSTKGSSRRQHASHQSTAQLIESLNTRRINTMTELRRIERIAAESSASDQLAFQQPMTSAWNAYVTSNNMLNELRGLTRNYPFSSEALDDAKWRVSNDPESNRSWNYAWLVLVKLKNDQMISAYAASEAAKPEMWGGEYPDQQDADQLATCFAFEWNEALEQMLRHWETPPTTTGY